MKRTSFVVLLLLATVACEGPMGPAGLPGPGTRIVLNATADEFGEAVVDLPSEAGTLTSPPAIACYLSDTGAVWLVVALDSTDTGVVGACLLGANTNGTLYVGMVGAPTGWLFRVVVVF